MANFDEKSGEKITTWKKELYPGVRALKLGSMLMAVLIVPIYRLIALCSWKQL
jgi:hypothetical protein